MSKSTKVETFFGDRLVVFVKYPSSWSAEKMIERLNWAKAYEVVSMRHDGTLVQAYVKEHYYKHFSEDNAEYIVEHEYGRLSGIDGEPMFTVEGAMYL